MSYPFEVLSEGPLLSLYWRLNEAAGSPSSADSSGNGHTGTVGGASLTRGVTGLLVGDSDKATAFTDGQALVASGSWLNTSFFTAECIVKPTASMAGLDQFLVARDVDGTTSTLDWRLGLSGGTPVGFVTTAGAPTTVKFVVSSVALSVGSTYHLALTFDGTSLKIYVNGVLRGTTAVSGTAKNTAVDLTCCDNRTGAGANNFTGVVDEIAVYSDALSAARILAHYTASVTAPNPPGVPTSVSVNPDLVTAALSWSAPASGGAPSSYQVRLNGGTPSTATSPHTFTGLTAGTAYSSPGAEVRAVNSDGMSAWVAVSFTTDPLPTVPTALAYATVGLHGLDLSWSPPATGAVDGYDVRIDAGSPTDVGLPGVLLHHFTGLTPSTGYTLEVRAYNAGGDGPWASIAATTADPPPPPEPGYYVAELVVGSHSWTVAHDDSPTMGPQLPLQLGWQVDDQVAYFPAMADPTTLSFPLLVDNADELSDVVEGTPVEFTLWIDTNPDEPPWQHFVGIVTQLEGGTVQLGDTSAFRVQVYASDPTLQLARIQVGFTGDWPQESIFDRLQRVCDEAGITLEYGFTSGGLEGTLAAHPLGPISVLAAVRDTLKDAAGDNTSEPPDEFYGRYVYWYDMDATTLHVAVFERRVFDGSTVTLDGVNVFAAGSWAKLPGVSPGTWAIVDGATFGTPDASPPIVVSTSLVDTLPLNPSAQTRDNLGESLVTADSTQLSGWYSRTLRYRAVASLTVANLVQSWAAWRSPGDATVTPLQQCLPVVVTPLKPELRLNDEDYLAGTLTGARLVIPPGGDYYVDLRLRPELLPGTELP